MQPSIVRRLWPITVACLAATIACGSSSGSSTTPTPTPTPTLASVSVTGTAPIVPNSSQFTATAIQTDSSSTNVSLLAAWSSSNIIVATVSNTGLVTALSQGDVVITAAYQDKIGRLAISIPRPNAFTINGTVTDGLSSGPLPGLTVGVLDTSFALRTTTTNSSGAYSISGVLAGLVAVSTGTPGYITTTKNLTLSADTRVDIVLPRATLP